MTKLEFMKELESLLSDIPLEERDEALNYYSGYIEDAGEEHEEDILKELGSPARVAGIIKADLNLNTTERENSGNFTENGYQDTIYSEEKYPVAGTDQKASTKDQSQQKGQNTNHSGYNYGQNTSQGSKAQSQGKNNDVVAKIVLIVLICIFGFPFIMAALGIGFGVISAVIGIIIGFGVAGVVMIVAGFSLFISGLTELGIPFFGFLLCGSGLLIFGIGMLFMVFTVFLCKSVLPAILKGIVHVCRMPFQNRSVIA